jgi:inosine-uridine nucleoside N-ribohydrolase
VISDNDYAGDPDGLFQLAHLALSPSVDLRGVIGSHLRPGDALNSSDQSATRAKSAAEVILKLIGRSEEVTVVEGSNWGLNDVRTPIQSAGARLIVSEAMREAGDPLWVTLGGGLTELASAYLLEPSIADRVTAVWIGGPEYPGVVPTLQVFEEQGGSEYNLRIDITAGQVIFDSPIPLWQVPRDAYRQAIMSLAELDRRVRPSGAIGLHLMTALDDFVASCAGLGLNLGEVYVLGDSPLVLLTALQSAFEPDPSSSEFITVPAPRISDEGAYVPRANGRPIRVYTRIDTRLLFEDMVAKLRAFA